MLCEASGASAAGSAPEILRLDPDAVPGDQLQQLPGDPLQDPDALVTLCYTEKTGSVTGGTVENKRTEATCYISYTCYRKINIIIYFP